MSRLASLSTPLGRNSPSSSPSPMPSLSGGQPRSPSLPPNGSTTPSSPAMSGMTGTGETTHHRMLKLLLNELKSLFRTWDELAGIDAIKFAKGVIDEGTTMDNILTQEEGPERELVTPHLEKLSEYRASFQAVLGKMDKLLGKIPILIEQAERILFEAYRTTSYDFVFVEPLWLSWTMEHFINSLPPLMHHHTLHLHTLTELSTIILDPATPFEGSKRALERWLALSRGGERWDAVREWEELVSLEVELGGRNGTMTDEEDGEEGMGLVSPAGGRKKKGKGKR